MVLYGGNTIATFNNMTEEACEMACISNALCKSINVDNSGDICHLNDKLDGDIDVVLVSQTGWSYKSTDHQNPLVSEVITCFSQEWSNMYLTEACK